MSRRNSAGTRGAAGPRSVLRRPPVVAETSGLQRRPARSEEHAAAAPRARATENGVPAALREVRASRKRLAVAADTERQRIERDIHDGAQQQLTALQIRLEMAAERHHTHDEDEISTELRRFARDLEEAIEELRELAHGVYPPLLASAGLGAALTSAARHAARPVTISCRIGRSTPEVERAVYFSCVEAMQNAAKHAGPSDVAVKVWETADALRFSVRDTGNGFDPASAPAGAGITNMRDRVGAVGGTLIIDTSPSKGTGVTGEVPRP